MMHETDEDTTHPCPVAGCPRRAPFGKLMCHEHWILVPRRLREPVYHEWKGGRPTARYPRVRAEAIKAVEDKERNRI